MIATPTLVTEIPARAMLDLEELGGEGFGAEYAVFGATYPTDDGGIALMVQHAGGLAILLVPADTLVPVITYDASNMLEAE